LASVIENTSGSTIDSSQAVPSSMPCSAQHLHDMGAETADRAFLDGEQDFVLARQFQDHVDVERFMKRASAMVGGQSMRAVRPRLLAFAETGPTTIMRSGALATMGLFRSGVLRRASASPTPRPSPRG